MAANRHMNGVVILHSVYFGVFFFISVHYSLFSHFYPCTVNPPPCLHHNASMPDTLPAAVHPQANYQYVNFILSTEFPKIWSTERTWIALNHLWCGLLFLLYFIILKYRLGIYFNAVEPWLSFYYLTCPDSIILVLSFDVSQFPLTWNEVCLAFNLSVPTGHIACRCVSLTHFLSPNTSAST